MYTGIVQGLEKILDVRQGHGFSTLVVSNNHIFSMMYLLVRALLLMGLA